MSLLRDSYPGYKANGTTIPQGVRNYSLINGQVSVGYKNGNFVDLSSIGQGIGTARFELKDQANNTQSVHVRMEDVVKDGKKDIGLNLKYIDSKLGDIDAYAYKDFSLMSSIKLLAEFANDTNNSSHILYEYFSQISSILNMLAGTTPLGTSSSKVAAKEAVLNNLANYYGVVSYDFDGYVEANSNFKLDPQSFNSVNDTIRIKLDLSSIMPSMKDPFTIVLDFSQADVDPDSVCTIRIENLPINGNYGCFEVNITKAYDDKGNFLMDKVRDANFILGVTDLQRGAYVDLTDLKILMQVGITTTKARSYRMRGHFKYVGYTYSLDIMICILPDVGSDGLHDVIAHIATSYGSDYSRIYSEVFVYYDVIYCKRKYNHRATLFNRWWTEYTYFKAKKDAFTTDVLYYIFVFLLNDESMYNTINKNQDTQLPTKSLDFIQSFKNERNPNGVQNKHQFTLAISGKLMAIASIKGTLHIEYDDNYNLIGVYAPLKVSILSVELDVDMQPYDETYLKNKSAYVVDFIETFNRPGTVTSNLGFRQSKDDLTNVYRVDVKDENLKPPLDPNKGY